MTAKHDFVPLSGELPQIYLEAVSETEAKIWFSLTECDVRATTLDGVCNDLFQRSHGAILVKVDDLEGGVLTIQRNPVIGSNLSLEEAAKHLAKRLCETCPENENYRSDA